MSERKIRVLYFNPRDKFGYRQEEIKYGTGRWVYLGKIYKNYYETRSSLNKNYEFIEISRKLDIISDAVRDDYNEYIDQLNRANKGIFEWWFSPLSSRSIYTSQVFQNICFLELVKDVYEKYDEDLLIVVESYSTGFIIEKWLSNEKIPFRSICRPYRRANSHFFQALNAIIKSCLKVLINLSFAIISRITSENHSKIGNISGKKNVVIDLFVYESNFTEDGSFKDRYFPSLKSYLVENGYNVIYHPTLAETKINKYDLYTKIRGDTGSFIIAEDYLKVSDYLKSFILAIKAVKFKKNIPYFKGIDISFADSCENKWVNFDGIFRSLLVYHLFSRLGGLIGNDIERIICWHENQLQDKALCLAVHNSFSSSKIVGTHHFIHYSNYLSLYPIDSEAEANLLPDVILTTGSFESAKLKKYLSSVPVSESVALRYSYVHRHDCIKRFEQKKEILILLPYDLNDAYEIIMRIEDIIDSIESFSKIIIKCHPDYDEKLILNTFGDLNIIKDCSFTREKLEDLIFSVSVIITSASSSLVETAVMGIPTIFLAKFNALNLNPFNSKEIKSLSICYDRKMLIESLNKFLLDSENNRVIYPNSELKKLFFEQANEENLKKIIE